MKKEDQLLFRILSVVVIIKLIESLIGLAVIVNIIIHGMIPSLILIVLILGYIFLRKKI
jgi:TRAP-type mannitol/chloroaromatic compound transport system permease large subunit